MKRLVSFIVSLMVLCVVVAACGGSRGAGEQLDRADALIDTRPDSALRLLDSLSYNALSDVHRARYGLLYTKAASKNYTPLADNSLISVAVDYYAGRGDSLEIQSLFYQGEAYSYARTSDSALLLLSRAYELAVPAHDYFYAAMSAREMSAVYRRLFMVDEGLNWAKEAKDLFIKAKKPVHAAWMDHLIADALIFSGHFEEAGALLDSISRIDYADNMVFRSRTLRNKIELALQLKSYSKIDSLYAALADAQYQFSAHDRLNQAKASIESGRYDDAAVYLSQARDLPMSDADSLYFGKMSSLLAAANGNYKTAYELSRGFSEDLMNSDAHIMTNPQTKLLTDNYKLMAENHRLQVARSRQLTIGLILGCILMVILIIFMRKNFRSRLSQKKLEVEKLLAESQTLHDDLTLNKNRYKELSVEGQIMKRTMADMETAIANEVRSLFSRHLDLLNRMCDIWYHNRGQSSRGNHIYKELVSMMGTMSHIEVTEELAEIINRHDNNWVDRFKKAYPDLSETEYRLALYLYIGFSPSTIAVLSNKENTQAVHIAKYKLKKKLTKALLGADQSLLSRLW
ncbi:MAG: hypothetical protein J6C91_03940 [Muribaculaceae bacterium]|nr:hypothetical protein [Muribaculaceae bacterium]